MIGAVACRALGCGQEMEKEGGWKKGVRRRANKCSATAVSPLNYRSSERWGSSRASGLEYLVLNRRILGFRFSGPFKRPEKTRGFYELEPRKTYVIQG